ncbi:hypothetical protein LJE17_22680, partial [Planktothrix agardhii 1031]|nr:hypothetical protein [Planktothrix agardhii 1031]
MPTTFENIKLKEDGTEGQIITISTFYVWDCTNQRFSTSPPVVLRNTMLAALYPAKEFIIGEIPKTSTNPSLLDPFKVPAVSDPYFLDLASNSRTHGRFLFTPKRTIGRDYFPKKDDWKRIIYGSILHTGCNRASHSYKFETDPRFAGVDLVIPLSCFKGNKPAPGNYTGKVLIGVVHEAEERRAKPGWMLWQWFSFET